MPAIIHCRDLASESVFVQNGTGRFRTIGKNSPTSTAPQLVTRRTTSDGQKVLGNNRYPPMPTITTSAEME
jgi:hypothetical protein